MSQTIHHVPGRIRVRCKALGCQSARVEAAVSQLESLPGVEHVRVNRRASSIVVQYDITLVQPATILSTLSDVGYLDARPRRTGSARDGLASSFGKAFAGAIVNKAVEHTARAVVGALI